MVEGKHLTLRLVRLACFEAWPARGEAFFFVLVKAGNGRLVSGSVEQDLGPDEFFVLDPTAARKVTATREGLVFWYFTACLEDFFPLLANHEICLLRSVIERFKAAKHLRVSDSVANQCRRLVETAPPQGGVNHRSHVLRIAAEVLAEEFNNARRQGVQSARVGDRWAAVFDELDSWEALNLSVADLARKINCSRRHLNRLFRQRFGCSRVFLRKETRLLKALSLLKDPDLTVLDVAKQCGYSHLGLFNASFKKRFGKLPGRWRRGV
jgi:AraC-like DNA-binding protein